MEIDTFYGRKQKSWGYKCKTKSATKIQESSRSRLRLCSKKKQHPKEDQKYNLIN
jgi:hypothetical protein